MNVLAPLIEEAWDHHRHWRRRTWGVAAALAALVLVATVVLGVSGGGASGGSGAGTPVRGTGAMHGSAYVSLPASKVFTAPEPVITPLFQGLVDHPARLLFRDHARLVIRLKRPARSVTAIVAGHRLRLTEIRSLERRIRLAPRRGMATGLPRRTVFGGAFLPPRGLYHWGRNGAAYMAAQRRIRVSFKIVEWSGKHLTTDVWTTVSSAFRATPTDRIGRL